MNETEWNQGAARKKSLGTRQSIEGKAPGKDKTEANKQKTTTNKKQQPTKNNKTKKNDNQQKTTTI